MGNAEVGAVLAKAETLERLDLAGKEEAMDIDLILSDNISANFEDRTLHLTKLRDLHVRLHRGAEGGGGEPRRRVEHHRRHKFSIQR